VWLPKFLKKLTKERSYLTGNEAEMVFRRRRDRDKVVKRRASIEKARKILGYEPKVNIRTGLKRTYGWVLENKERIEQVAKF